MSHKIFVHADGEFASVAEALETACLTALRHENAAPGEISIVLVGEDRMRHFNLQFADMDKPTDVLAFTDGSVDPDSNTTYHGDIIICFPIAEMQASISGTSISDELCLLAVHGVLHLLGYDHSTEEKKSEMWKTQSVILQQLGCTITFPEES
jgi:probable rRNA maturation factor